MFERFTEKAIKVVMLSQEESRRLGHNFVGTEQILLGLIGENGGVAYKVLRSLGVTLREARTEVERIIGRGSGFVAVEIPFTPRAKRVLEIAIEEARDLGHGYIGTEHILLALLEEEVGVGVRVLQQLGLEVSQIRTEVLMQIGETLEVVLGGDRSEFFEMSGVSIEEFTTNLTEAAFNGKLDPVVGRDEEIERVIQILARRRKNNPVLIGEPGVGKTAVAEGLAQRIVKRDVPDLLDEKQVISLDIGLLLAGTKYRGEFEERLKRIIDEVRSSNNIILVIDEVHTLIGAGAAEGAVDAANILKPALARGELQCIGATTIDEYRKHIERDSALERRFQPVQIDEPSVSDTVQILRCLRPSYERHHGLKISDEALEAAASMGAQYIADRFLPDKAIDLIDEAGSRVRLKAVRMPDAASDLDRELRDIIKEKDTAIADQNFEVAATALDRELELRAQLSAILATVDRIPGPAIKKMVDPVVTEDDIANVVSAWTGIPVNKISKSESEKLLHMEETLHSRIIGQEQAVSAVSRAIRRARVGLRNPNRPIASFLFSGPTGVGKTELTKALALYFFGAEDAMVRLDMSEFMERHTVAKLIGSPPGYVGYSEGGQLTEAVRRKPYTVVLFDEVEKAHPDVFNLLLQILEDGRLTDSKGRTIDFKNTMLILTSNIGAKVIQENDSSSGDIGFGGNLVNGNDSSYDRMASLVNEELKRFFRPEFLNRLDEIIVFRQLTRNDLSQIADIMLKQLCDRAEDKSFTLKVTQRAKLVLINEGFNPTYGARPLRRAIMKLLEDRLATQLLSESIEPGSMILVDSPDQKELVINISKVDIDVDQPVMA
uniref:ATP-dependent clp protease ATP-binding subunit n=1 Tax=Aureoumbra lagunensis TaxID=44058 RepID=C6KJ41_9STRA|nr:ATP-dependent clp protease ATP-binding subunit [Aureoumbra lagunensis]ACS36997.1 ATP-dependent clp protease ATP-binding subunit [Aureoumbra lagunensis]